MAFHALTSNWRRHEKDMGLPGVVKRLAEVSSIVSIRGVNQVRCQNDCEPCASGGGKGVYTLDFWNILLNTLIFIVFNNK